MTLKTIKEYVDVLMENGEVSFRAVYPHPMIVRRGADEDEDGPNYNTVLATRETLAKAAKAKESPEQPLEVYPIRKRPGAPFPDRVGVGRTRNADVCVPFPAVSKYHAYFSASGEKHCITDAGSKNGTFVDGKRLPAREEHELSNGNGVSFGPYHFTYYSADGFYGLVERRAQGSKD